MVNKLALMSCLLAASSSSMQPVDARGKMTKPLAKFLKGTVDTTGPSAFVNGSLVLPAGGKWFGPVEPKALLFATKFKEAKFNSILDLLPKQTLVQGASAQCGFTDSTNKQLLPETVEWIFSSTQGFIHQGPCEVWCDNERAFQNDNCGKNYPGYPAKLPYDKSKCVGKSMLKFVSLALHDGAKWQVFTNCAGIETKPAVAVVTNYAAPVVVKATDPVVVKPAPVVVKATDPVVVKPAPVVVKATTPVTTAPVAFVTTPIADAKYPTAPPCDKQTKQQ